MGKEIFNNLFYSFLFSLGLSLLILLFISGNSGGSEAKQATGIMIFYILFILLSCLVSSMTAFFNLIPEVRRNLPLSILSFFALPLSVHIFTILQNTEGDFSLLLLLFYAPSSLYLLALVYHFYLFRKNTKSYQKPNNS
ncbi:MAG TPA: hypothetical protein DIT10_04030 [Chryseobacterium sp.]|nr:hypothetical protein [Chryseobacterium sp.]